MPVPLYVASLLAELDAERERVAVLRKAAQSTLDAMAMDPCDCMAHRSPPELLLAALSVTSRLEHDR